MSIKPEELKPCPFCGSSKAFAMNAESSVFCFGCDACDARVYGISEKAAKKRWNTRAIGEIICIWDEMLSAHTATASQTEKGEGE